MRIFIVIFLIALALTAFGTPLVRRLALFLGFVDAPAARKLHQEPMPLMGGLAIFGGAIVAVLALFTALPSTNVRSPEVMGVLLACLIMVVIGLVDDRKGLPAWAKLLGQFAGFVALAHFGIRMRLDLPEWANLLLTFGWLAAISNAINFLDNMDGLSAGVSDIAAAFMLLLATFNDQYLVAAVAASVLGACLGFLRYNFKPARIFMGDAGALFLGFILAILGIQLRFPDNVNFVTWMAPVFILGLPLFDLALVIVSRLRRGVNPFTTAGKDHTSHRLVEMGFSQREAVLILYLAAVAFGMGGLFITRSDVAEGYALGGLTAGLALVAIWRLERRRERLPNA